MMSHASSHTWAGALAPLRNVPLVPLQAFAFCFTSFLEISPYFYYSTINKFNICGSD